MDIYLTKMFLVLSLFFTTGEGYERIIIEKNEIRAERQDGTVDVRYIELIGEPIQINQTNEAAE